MSAPAPIRQLDDALAYALQWHAEGLWSDAEAVYRAVLAADPGHAAALQGLGVLRFQMGAPDEGWTMLQRASTLAPDDHEAWGNLANAARVTERFAEGVEAADRALALRPGFVTALVSRSACLRALDRVSESLADSRAALEMDPENADAWVNLGAALAAVGDATASADAFERAERLAPGRPDAVSNRLFALQYRDDLPASALRAAAECAMGPGRTPAPSASRGPLRTIGFVSGDLRRHPVGYFIAPLLRSLDRERYRVVLFAHQAKSDALSAELRAHADAWHDLRGLTTAAARALAMREQVDVLIDLSGHSAENRLDLFAARSAPVQATYLGYSATTGLPEMDAWLADAETVPVGSEGQATERIERLDGGVYAFDPSRVTAEVAEAPWRANGFVTFGSFNNNLKMTPVCLETWAEILRRVTDARLLLKYRSFNTPEARDRVTAVLMTGGIDPSRVDLAAWSPEADHYDAYRRLDIALDPFPYTGATTTVEAVYMGVPTVTLAGDRYASRMSASVLSRIGRASWVTTSREDYVEVAVALAGDRARLDEERASLRPAVLRSSLCDHAAFARSFEAALERLWTHAASNR